jgi:uncharacterized membrane protein YagU involved in acid resistance
MASLSREGRGDLLLRGVVGGLVAGGVFAALNMWYAATVGGSITDPLQMIGRIPEELGAGSEGTATPVVGAVVHIVLSVVYGLIFALIATRVRTNGGRSAAGAAYGLVLYVVNFLLVAPLALPFFLDANQPFELAAHIVFGVVLGIAFYRSGVTEVSAARSREEAGVRVASG